MLYLYKRPVLRSEKWGIRSWALVTKESMHISMWKKPNYKGHILYAYYRCGEKWKAIDLD